MTSKARQTPTTAEELEAAQAAEWSTYRARVPVDYYGTRAYNVGDPVPVSAVQPDGWVPAEYVDKAGDTSEVPAGSPTVVDPGPPTIDPTVVAAPPAATPTPEV